MTFKVSLKIDEYELKCRWYVRARYFIERTHIRLTSLTNKKSIPEQTEAPEKGLRPQQTSIRRGESNSFGSKFVVAHFSHVLKNKRPKNDHTKLDPKYSDSPRRKLFNGDLGIVVALLVRSDFFCRLVLGVQSSCTLACI